MMVLVLIVVDWLDGTKRRATVETLTMVEVMANPLLCGWTVEWFWCCVRHCFSQ